MKKPPRAVACDLDGTLLRSDLTVSERSRAALAAVEAAGALLPLLRDVQDYVWRRHLASAAGHLLEDTSALRRGETLMSVCFVDIVGYTTRSRSMTPDELAFLVERFESVVTDLITEHSGRVVKTIGDEVMSLFPDASHAASAARDIQLGMHDMAPVGKVRMGVRIGMHHGAVVERDGDVFGDTVNLAARLVAQAVKGQIITTSATADMLPPPLRGMTRDLYAINVKGKADEISLCEVIWKRHDEDTTVMVSGRRPSGKRAPVVLKLKYRDKEIIRRRDTDSIDVGRDPACGLVIADHMASRQHCTLERRQDKYVIKDHSTNGTYVTMEGDTEQHLLREEVALRKHGWIAFGQPRAQASPEEVVEFFVDS